jgi:hypothetical protein
MVRIPAEGLRYDLVELRLDLIDGLAGGEAGPVADAEDMRVDREGLLAEGGIEHDIRGLTADAGKLLQLFAGMRDPAAMPVDQGLAKQDDVLGLGVEQADRLDCLA